MTQRIAPAQRGLTLALTAVGLLSLSACSTLDSLSSGDKIDYRSQAARGNPLEVPPDLTPLAQDGRYLPQGGTVSASAISGAANATAPRAGAPSVAVTSVADVRLERDGNTRWLVTSRTPEEVWPTLRQFWQDRGFTLAVDNPAVGVMETEWAENRAKIPQDFIRNAVGKYFDSLYSTGERDKFRVRVERGAKGSEITLVHQGMQEVLQGANNNSNTIWTNRPEDPTLVSEMLSRLMVALGAQQEAARAAVVASPAATSGAAATSASPAVAGAPRARTVTGGPAAALQVDDNAERTWRRVGLALDRGGYTIEDRDRAQGLYFVRVASASQASDRGFWNRLTNIFSSDKANEVLGRHRVKVSADGAERSTVVIQDGNGGPDQSEAANKIVQILVGELK